MYTLIDRRLVAAQSWVHHQATTVQGKGDIQKLKIIKQGFPL